MTAVVDPERQFSLLTNLLELARSQERALHDADFVQFEDLMHKRVEVLRQIQDLQRRSEPLPDNVVLLQTAFQLGHELDTTTATDIVIRLILDQDAVNERLLVDALGAAAVPA